MEIGEAIQLNEAECRALQFGDSRLADYWPLSSLARLEVLVRERIIDKQSVLAEIRQEGRLAESTTTVFRLRSDLTTLYAAHEQLFSYALRHQFEMPPPEA